MSDSPLKPVIGIVGGIGSGKTTVAAHFASLGCAVIDADAIGHEVLEDANVKQALRDRWGAEVFDKEGRVDRSAVAGIVFSDAAELAALNAIVHPLIRRDMESQIAVARQLADVPAVVLDAAVLFEAGWDDVCTHTVFVDAPRSERFQRVRSQRGWDEATFASRENAQIEVDTKAALCDHTLSNHASDSHLADAVRYLLDAAATMSEST
ncbi:MAG: dephospho-CoA kinase [Planctomycetota bacterium]|jgi:dephospho-CoA kinase